MGGERRNGDRNSLADAADDGMGALWGQGTPTVASVLTSSPEERAALVALLRARPGGATWPQMTAEVADSGSALEVWRRHSPLELFDAHSVGDVDTLADAMRDINAWDAADFTFLTFADASYPAQLRDVHQFPPVLFSRGELRQSDRAISIVGSRSASDRALNEARDIARMLVEQDVTILSGLARGIDTVAHLAALDAGGRTVAIIGSGITRYYPAENRELQDRIASDGLLLSQFWPDSSPTRHTFPMRNAVMSAYGCATIVVEASEASGSRIQARLAVEHGRPVILTEAVARGTHWGRALVGRPCVSVATTPADAVEAACAAIAVRDEFVDLLAIAVE